MSRYRRRRRSRRRAAARAAASRMFSDASTSHEVGSAPAHQHPIPFVLATDTLVGPDPDGSVASPELDDTEAMMEPGTRDHEATVDTPVSSEPPPRWIPAQEASEAAAPTPEPPSDELLFRAARQAELNGAIGRAIGIYRELLDRHESHMVARANLAVLLGRTGQHDAALVQLATCLAQEPDNTDVLVSRAVLLASLTRFTEAERDLQTVLGIEPGNVEAHYHLGLVLSRKGRWADATPYLRRTIELDSSRASAYFYLGEALNHVDDLDGALRCYQRAAELSPNDSRALYGIGIVLDRLNRPDEAAQLYRRSRELLRK